MTFIIDFRAIRATTFTVKTVMDTCINTLSSTVQPQDRQINWIQVTLDLIRTVNPPLEFVCGVVDIISKYFKSTENANIQHTNCQKTNATILNLAGPSSSCHLILMCVNYSVATIHQKVTYIVAGG